MTDNSHCIADDELHAVPDVDGRAAQSQGCRRQESASWGIDLFGAIMALPIKATLLDKSFNDRAVQAFCKNLTAMTVSYDVADLEDKLIPEIATLPPGAQTVGDVKQSIRTCCSSMQLWNQFAAAFLNRLCDLRAKSYNQDRTSELLKIILACETEVDWGMQVASTDVPLCAAWNELEQPRSELLDQCKKARKILVSAQWCQATKDIKALRVDVDTCQPWSALLTLSGKSRALLMPLQFQCLPEALPQTLDLLTKLKSHTDDFIQQSEGTIATATMWRGTPTTTKAFRTAWLPPTLRARR